MRYALSPSRLLAVTSFSLAALAAHAQQPTAWGITGWASTIYTREVDFVTTITRNEMAVPDSKVEEAAVIALAGGANAQASAKLDGGSLHLSAFTPPNFYSGLNSSPRIEETYGAGAWFEMWDTISIRANEPIPWRLAIDGSLSGNSSFGYYMSIYSYETGKLRDWVGGYKSVDDETDWPDVLELDDQLLAGLGNNFVSYKLYFRATVSAGGGYEKSSSANFGNTMKFMWDLPEDATYTSASGKWNPGSIQAVPEPASMATLTAGALALLRRRRRSGAR